MPSKDTADSWKSIPSLSSIVGSIVGPIVDNVIHPTRQLGEKALRGAADIASLIAKPITALATYTPETEAAIRPRGSYDLNMFHYSSDPYAVASRRVFTAPSIAISSNRGNPFAGNRGVNLVLNPNYSGFDPAASKNQLYTRDGYVSRSKSPQRPGLSGEDIRLTEKDSEVGLQQALSILLSPRFSSFEQFEKSPLGADLIRKFGDGTGFSEKRKAARSSTYKFQEEHYPNYLTDKPSVQEFLALVREHATKGDTTARRVITRNALMPSDYAELKMVEELPLNADTVSAVFIPELLKKEKTLRKSIEKSLPGVPVGTPEELLPTKHEYLYRQLAENIYETSTTSPLITNPYGIYRSGAFYDSSEVLNQIMRSDKFTSDVASMLTAGEKASIPSISDVLDPTKVWDDLFKI